MNTKVKIVIKILNKKEKIQIKNLKDLNKPIG